jgi:hypothetical protein
LPAEGFERHNPFSENREDHEGDPVWTLTLANAVSPVGNSACSEPKLRTQISTLKSSESRLVNSESRKLASVKIHLTVSSVFAVPFPKNPLRLLRCAVRPKKRAKPKHANNL